MKNACMLLICVYLLAGCTPPAAPSPTLQPATPTLAIPTSTNPPQPTLTPTLTMKKITVFQDKPLQTIKDVGGGNFIHQTGGILQAFDRITQLNYDTFQPRYGRVRIVMEEWEPENDNEDPNTINWSAFKDAGYNHATFLLMQEFQKQGINISASIWTTPDWMVTNPYESSQRVIDPAKYPELVESLTAWLLMARDTYGVNVNYVSFNESNGGYSTLVPANAYAEIIRQSEERFTREGLQVKWYLGDTYNIQSTMSYVVSIWSDKSIRPYLGPLTFHSWDLDAPDSSISAIAKFAEREGLDVWCTEVGWDAELWQYPDRLASFEHAIKLAKVYSRMIKLSRTSVFMYWQMAGDDYAINNGTKGYPAFDILRQLTEQVPAGSVVLETSPDTTTLHSFAVQAPEHFMVYLVNFGKKAIQVQVDGLPVGKFTHILSTEEKTDQVAGTYESSGTLLVNLPAQSVNILTTK